MVSTFMVMDGKTRLKEGYNMPFIAYVGVKLKYDFGFYEKDKWYPLKTIHGIQYQWRFTSDFKYEVVCGTFAKKEHAEIVAKYTFTTVLYNLLRKDFAIDDDCCRLWGDEFYREEIDGDYGRFIDNLFLFEERNKVYRQTNVFVVPVEHSLDDFKGLSFSSNEGTTIVIDDELSFDNYDKSFFQYCKEGQQLYHTIIMADNTKNLGIKMTLYCGILEHLVKDYEKDQAIIEEIDELIKHVEESDLSRDQKQSLKGRLNDAKKVSSRQKCRDFVKKYGREKYGNYTGNQIINSAYDIRSAFSHGSNCDNMYDTPAEYMKAVVLEVINNYMHEKDVRPVM